MATAAKPHNSYKKFSGQCSKRAYPTRDMAKAAIEELKSKKINGQPYAGSSTLHSWKCHKCTSKKGEVFHIGHINRRRILNG